MLSQKALGGAPSLLPCRHSLASSACRCNTPTSASVISGILPVHLSLCPSFPLLERMPIIGLGSTLIQHDLILTSLCMQKPYFQIRLCSQVQDANNQLHRVPVGKVGCPVHSSYYRTRPLHSSPCRVDARCIRLGISLLFMLPSLLYSRVVMEQDQMCQ